MRNQLSLDIAVLSLALLTGAGNTALAQDGADSTGTAIPGNRDTAIEAAAQNDSNDDCVNTTPGVAAGQENESSGVTGAPETLGTDARIDTSRVNCLDEHNDAPHEDNLRLENPNVGAPSDRTDLIIDEDQRNPADTD